MSTRPIRLSRRHLLAAMGAGAAWAPLSRIRAGRAADTDPPRYVILLFTPCGVVPHLWGAYCPQPTGAAPRVLDAPELRPSFAPLAPYRSKLSVVAGLNVMAADGTHEAGMGALWTGVATTGDGLAPSFDQVVARELSPPGTFAFDSLPLRVRSTQDLPARETRTRMTYRASGSYVDPLDDPQSARATLFPELVSNAGATDQRTFIRDRVLHDVGQELKEIGPRFCREDREQLDALLQASQDLSAQFAKSLEVSQRCAARPMGATSDSSTLSDFPTCAKLQMDLLAASLACDLTRVATLQFSTATSNVTHTWLGEEQRKTHHEYSHEGPAALSWLGTDISDPANASQYSSLPQLSAIDRWYAEQVGYLAWRLDQYRVGGESLLDRTVICWGSEVAIGAPHSHDSAPFALIGSCGGRLKTGRAVRFPTQREGAAIEQDRTHNDLMLTLAKAFGTELSVFGDPRLCTGVIRELLV